MFTKGSQMVRQDRIDVFWAPWPLLPFFLPGQTTVTVLDFVWWYYPQTMHWSQWVLYNIIGRGSIIRADAMFAISQSTLNDVVKLTKNKNNAHLGYLGLTLFSSPMIMKNQLFIFPKNMIVLNSIF